MKNQPTSPPAGFQPLAEAILVLAHHAAPLPPGARVWVDERSSSRGAISMGCVDQDVVGRLCVLLKSGEPARLVHYAEGNELTGEVGLTCGGRIEVLLRRVPDPDPIGVAVAALGEDQVYTLVTGLAGSEVGRQRLYRADQPPLGSLGISVLDEAADRALAATEPPPGARVLELGGLSCLVERHEMRPPLLVVGASAIAAQLCRYAAQAGYRVHLADPRRELARADRFPDVASIQHAWPGEAFDRLQVDERWYVAVLAHDLKLDTPALAEALRRNCRYVGLLGSSKTQEKHRGLLLERGFAAAAVASVRGPIGLRIGAITPEEIAVSILAELIQTRRASSVRR